MNDVLIVLFVGVCIAGVGVAGLGLAALFQWLFEKRPLK